MIKFKIADPTDSQAFSNLAEKIFRETFEKDNTPEDLAIYLNATFSEEKQRTEILDPKQTIVLVKLDQDQEWVGYFQLQEGSADPSITGKNPLQIKRFYVDALHHGQGVAFAMMNEVIRLSQTKKFQTLWLGVWESNDRAIAFYRKWGFLEVGDIIFYVGTDPQRDLILQKLL